MDLDFGHGFIPRIGEENYKAVDRCVGPTDLFSSSLDLPWAIVDGAWAERKPELLGTLREHGTKLLIDTHGWRFRYDTALEVEKLRAASWAPPSPVSPVDNTTGAALVQTSLRAQAELEAGAYFLPGWLPTTPGEDLRPAYEQIVETASQFADVPPRPFVLFVGGHTKGLDQVVTLLEDLPHFISGIYLQMTPVGPMKDGPSKLETLTSIYRHAASLGFKVIAGHAGAVTPVLRALGVDAADAGLAIGEGVRPVLDEASRQARSRGNAAARWASIADVLRADRAIARSYRRRASACRARRGGRAPQLPAAVPPVQRPPPVLHTPGHTPEHISLLLYDRSASADEPALLLSGGALLVGDLARPDLLGGREQAEESAKVFCHTIQKRILELPDHLEVFPTHVAGSLCGGNIGSRLSTTLGYERRTNVILAKVSSKGEFVEQCLRLDNLPAVPPYWRRMRRQNLKGVATLGVLDEPPALKPQAVKSAAQDGAVVLDTRSPEAFGGGHVPGALNVGQGAAFATWAGTVLDEDARLVLVLDDPADLWSITWDLLRIGYKAPLGWLAGGMMAWRTAALDIERLAQITVHELRAKLESGEVNLLDVRQPAEWAAGHIEGATFITGGALPGHLEEVPDGKPLAVTCGSGYRSSVYSSLLVRTRNLDVLNVLGGMSAWKAAGYPTTKED